MADWYAATDGTAGGAGTLASPWDLATALADTTNIGGGDTLYLRGGTYVHPTRTANAKGYPISLVGAAGSPVTVRPYQSERPIIDGGLHTNTENPQHVVLRELEVIVNENVGDTRIVTTAGSEGYTDLARPWGGIDIITGSGIKIVNCLIHDNAQGIGFWAGVAGESELYGNIIYNNGWDGPDRMHGHGMYIQNGTDTVPAASWKHIRENILINNWSLPYQAYGSSAARVDLLEIASNASMKGATSDDGHVQIAGDYPSTTIRVVGNIADRGMTIGSAVGAVDAVVKDNIAIEGAVAINNFSRLVAGNNFFWDVGWLKPRVDNVEIDIPTEPYVYLTPNRYDPYRANLVIMNWPETANADVDFSGFLNVGDTFRLMTPTDLWGTPAHTGTWQGTPLAIPVASAQYSIFIAFRGPPTGGTAGWQ